MSRYIDVDVLKETIRSHCYLVRGKYNEIMDGMYLIGIEQAIDEQPNIDTVKHAHWIKSELGTVFCSACDHTAPSMDDYYGDAIWYYDTPYCPYCGAKMREEVDE